MLIKEEKFLTSDYAESCTQICQSTLFKLYDEDNEEYNLVDTPGIFDTRHFNDGEIMDEIGRSIVQCSHGIKAILFVIKWGRYTKEQQITTEKILKFLGQESCRNMIVVFTHCNKAQTMNRSKMEGVFTDDLKSFLDKIGNRWVVSPNLEIFDKPNDPIVERRMNELRHYISLNPEPYNIELFKKVRIAREKELKEIEAREKVNGKEEKEGKLNAGVETAKDGFKESGGGCFSLHSKAILADGKRIEMSQLSIGDKVCCGEKNGKLIFSEIYAIVHTDNQTMTQYQKINYLKADGTEGILRLTSKHHLFVSQGKTIFAEDVKAYVTEILLLDGEKLVPVIPHQVEKEYELGYIAPFTQSGRIVADEILCSCYAVALPYQEIINFAMIPFRLYSWVMPATDYKKEIHPYLRYLKHGQWLLELIDYFNTI